FPQCLEQRPVGFCKGRGLPFANRLVSLAAPRGKAEHEGLLLPKKNAACFGDRKTAVTGKIDIDQAQCDELAKNCAPGAGVMFLADTVSGHTIVAKAADAFILRTKKDVDDVSLTKAFASSMDAGQRLLRGNRSIEELRGFQAGV